MNRDEFIAEAKDMLNSMAPHITKRKTATMLRNAVNELDRKCRWKKDTAIGGYDTECDRIWWQAKSSMLYCPYCGGKINE